MSATIYRTKNYLCLPDTNIVLLLVSAKHVFVSNNTGLGNRQVPSQEVITAVRLKFRPSQDINLTMDSYICYFEAHSVILQQLKVDLYVQYIGCPRK